MEICSPKKKSKLELADIFREYLPLFLQKHKVHPHQFKVINAIINCRTAKLGAHIDQCDHCKYLEISYNSCRDRHCPKCHSSKQKKWLANQVNQLLPVPYFHLVFTLPHLLNDLFLCNQKLLYNLFFTEAIQTLNQFASDPKHLGGKTGCIGILHTWGQNLGYHVHLHFIVAGGAISADQSKWIHKKHNGKFLFPVKQLQKVFKGKFMSALVKAHEKGQLAYPGELNNLKHPVFFADFKNRAYKLPWIIYAKRPFAGPEQVLAYIGRYTHRVAIANNRIVSMDKGVIRFKYKDYRDNSKNKKMSLQAVEFIRRYLQHILPYRFVKIRHGGFLAGGYRKKLLQLAARLIGNISKKYQEAKKKLESCGAKILSQQGISCPACLTGKLKYQLQISPLLTKIIINSH